MVHLSTIEQLKEDNPRQVRLYLTQMRDYNALRDWDKSQIKDSRDK